MLQKCLHISLKSGANSITDKLNCFKDTAAIFPYQIIHFIRPNAGQIRAPIVLVIYFAALVEAYRRAVIYPILAAHAVAARFTEDVTFEQKIFGLEVYVAFVHLVMLEFVLG